MFRDGEDFRFEFVQADIFAAAVADGERFAERWQIVIAFMTEKNFDARQFRFIGSKRDFQTDAFRRPDFGGCGTAALPVHRTGNRDNAVTAVIESVGGFESVIPRRLQKAAFELSGDAADRIFHAVHGDGDFRLDGAQELFAGEEIFQADAGEIGGEKEPPFGDAVGKNDFPVFFPDLCGIVYGSCQIIVGIEHTQSSLMRR